MNNLSLNFDTQLAYMIFIADSVTLTLHELVQSYLTNKKISSSVKPHKDPQFKCNLTNRK